MTTKYKWCQPRWLLSALLVVGAALFAVGVTAERSEKESGETTEESEESEEGFLGVNLESPVFVIAGVGASLGLAVATWRSNARRLLIATGLFATVFTALDIAEAVGKFSDSEAGIGALALTVGVIHAAAAFVADQRLPQSPT